MRRLPRQGDEKMMAKVKDRLAFLMMLGLLILFFVFLFMLMSAALSGCGELGDYYGSSYGDGYRDSGSSCADICERHCNTCWSWSSDILKCETRCETLCRQRGCSYIDVWSPGCDDAFQSTCS